MIGSHPFPVLSPAKALAMPHDVAVWTQRQYDIVQTMALRVRIMAATQATARSTPSSTMKLRAVRASRFSTTETAPGAS